MHRGVNPASKPPVLTGSRLLWRVSPPVLRGFGRGFFSMQVERESDLPPPPFVVAANHYSHFDPPLITLALEQPIRFLALEDLFGVNGVLHWLLEGYGAISTPRDRVPIGAIRTALAALEGGENVAVFPEATRVSHWGTLPAKRGAAWLAIRANVPLLPVAVIGTGHAMDLDNQLHRAPIKALIGRALEPTGDATDLTTQWSEWISAQIARHPGSEVSGPARSFHAGPKADQ